MMTTTGRVAMFAMVLVIGWLGAQNYAASRATRNAVNQRAAIERRDAAQIRQLKAEVGDLTARIDALSQQIIAMGGTPVVATPAPTTSSTTTRRSASSTARRPSSVAGPSTSPAPPPSSTTTTTTTKPCTVKVDDLVCS